MQSVWGVDHGGEIAKSKDWQTINQRELKASRARRRQRASGSTAAAGAGAALAGYVSRPEEAHALGGALKQAGNLHRAGLKGPARHLAKTGLRANPVGAVTLGGLGVAAAGASAWGVNRSMEAHQQRGINARRKRNAGISKAFGQTLAQMRGGTTKPSAPKGPTAPKPVVAPSMGAKPTTPGAPKPATPGAGGAATGMAKPMQPPKPVAPKPLPGVVPSTRSLLKPTAFAAGRMANKLGQQK